jgi:hypothetical protein
MKNLLSRKWMQNLTEPQRDLLLGLSIVMIVATLYYFQWAFYLTGLEGSKVNIDQPERYFWWANDSRSYQAAGEWLFGRDTNTAIANRPWLYPLFLGLTRTLFAGNAERVAWISQFLMWLGSGVFIYLGLQNITRSTVLAMLGTGFFFSHPSPLILTFHGMTETLNILLISAFCWVLTTTLKNRMVSALLLITLATVTKPIYLVFLILLVIYILVRYKQSPRLRQMGLIALILLPIGIQLLLSFIATGRPTLSKIGAYTFKNYLVADVYARKEGTEWRATMELIKDWNTPQQLTYLWQNQRLTLLTFRSHLIDENLWTGSFFTLGEGNRMQDFAFNMNAVSAYLHLLMLPFVLYYLLSTKYREHKETIALLYICFLLQLLTSGISAGQNDRLLITALPLWIIAYLSVLHGMSRGTTFALTSYPQGSGGSELDEEPQPKRDAPTEQHD